MSDQREMYDLCAVDDLEPGIVKEIAVGKRRVGVVRVGDDVRVFGPTCPHFKGPLTRGRARNFLTSEEDTARLGIDPDRWVLICPWHRWEFDLGTGQALCDPTRRMLVFDSEIRDGRAVTRLQPIRPGSTP